MRVLELFGGIGAPRAALDRLNVDYEVVDYVEIDKFAVKSYNNMYDSNFEPQDIRTWEKDLDADIVFHGSPCQDFSYAGRLAGADKGSDTQSSLMWHTVRIVDKVRPKVVIWENVRSVLNERHKHNFDQYIDELNELGYTSYYDIISPVEFGIPQKRERVFVVSILEEHVPYEFIRGTASLRDYKEFLETSVDDKYLVSDAMLKYIVNENEKWTGNNGEALANKTILSTINTREGGRRCDASNYISPLLRDDIDLKTIDVSSDLKLRKLTPLECFRFMGFTDEEFYKAQQVNSNTQLYKQAGNRTTTISIRGGINENYY